VDRTILNEVMIYRAGRQGSVDGEMKSALCEPSTMRGRAKAGAWHGLRRDALPRAPADDWGGFMTRRGRRHQCFDPARTQQSSPMPLHALASLARFFFRPNDEHVWASDWPGVLLLMHNCPFSEYAYHYCCSEPERRLLLFRTRTPIDRSVSLSLSYCVQASQGRRP
jgi:hypothetical protein